MAGKQFSLNFEKLFHDEDEKTARKDSSVKSLFFFFFFEDLFDERYNKTLKALAHGIEAFQQRLSPRDCAIKGPFVKFFSLMAKPQNQKMGNHRTVNLCTQNCSAKTLSSSN